MRFRPCIDLKDGKVVQIVGGTLRDKSVEEVELNYVSKKSSEDFARLYAKDALEGGHVIALGPDNEEAVLAALSAYPGGLQYGGGVNPENALHYLKAGASHVIVTSYIFSEGKFNWQRLDKLLQVTGKDKLVLDLSCRKKAGEYYVVTDRWQTFTDEMVNEKLLRSIGDCCAELLVHGVDVEGKKQGIEEDLINILGNYSPVPVTYAGGISSLNDLMKVKKLGNNRVDATIGSALDIFGGQVPYTDVLQWNAEN